MKNLKKYARLLMVLILCLSLAACGGKVSIEDLEGFWYPPEGIGSTMSVLTCIYIDGTAETWQEYDQYGDPTEYTGAAYTDGTVLTLTDVPLIGDVEIPIGDADTLVTDTGETYWIRGEPDFKKEQEQELSAFTGRWYYKGDRDSEFAMILTLNEDGTYTKGDVEEGTYTYKEYDEFVGNTGTDVPRQEISFSGGFMEENYYLFSDGQVLMHWAENGDDYYIHEDALENTQLLTEYMLTDGRFFGENYSLQFRREHTIRCEFFDDTLRDRTGTWELDGDMVMMSWDDGETDEALASGRTLLLSSTGETLENPFDF